MRWGGASAQVGGVKPGKQRQRRKTRSRQQQCQKPVRNDINTTFALVWYKKTDNPPWDTQVNVLLYVFEPAFRQCGHVACGSF